MSLRSWQLIRLTPTRVFPSSAGSAEIVSLSGAPINRPGVSIDRFISSRLYGPYTVPAVEGETWQQVFEDTDFSAYHLSDHTLPRVRLAFSMLWDNWWDSGSFDLRVLVNGSPVWTLSDAHPGFSAGYDNQDAQSGAIGDGDSDWDGLDIEGHDGGRSYGMEFWLPADAFGTDTFASITISLEVMTFFSTGSALSPSQNDTFFVGGVEVAQFLASDATVEVVYDDDARLRDARTPLAHRHQGDNVDPLLNSGTNFLEAIDENLTSVELALDDDWTEIASTTFGGVALEGGPLDVLARLRFSVDGSPAAIFVRFTLDSDTPEESFLLGDQDGNFEFYDTGDNVTAWAKLGSINDTDTHSVLVEVKSQDGSPVTVYSLNRQIALVSALGWSVSLPAA